MSDGLDEWVRANKKQIAREFIRKTEFSRSDTPVAIITAGLPGAGKTEFTQELLKQIDTQPLRIDMDEIATLIEGYRPQIADKFIDTYMRVYENLGQLNQFGNKIAVSLIIKKEDNKVGALYEGVVDILQEIPNKLTRIELEELLQ